MWKEIVLLIACVIYLVYVCWKSWGKRYKCIGLEEKYYKRFVNSSISKEEQCRNIFENLFNVPFIKHRPDFLKNPSTGKNLELDGWNPNIPTPIGRGLAFEFNGPQHYHFTPRYHKTDRDFEDQIERDKLKRYLCDKYRVMLITIPYTVTDLFAFISKKLYEKELYYYIR